MRRNSDDKKPLFWIKCEPPLDLSDTRGGLSLLVICGYDDYTMTTLLYSLSLSTIYIYMLLRVYFLFYFLYFFFSIAILKIVVQNPRDVSGNRDGFAHGTYAHLPTHQRFLDRV